MNGVIAPKSNVIEVADPISLRGRQHSDTAPWRVGRDTSGVRTAGMQPKDLTGTREICPVQASAPTSRQGEDGPTTGRKSDQLIVLGERESRGKRLATDDSFWGDTGSMQRE